MSKGIKKQAILQAFDTFGSVSYEQIAQMGISEGYARQVIYDLRNEGASPDMDYVLRVYGSGVGCVYRIGYADIHGLFQRIRVKKGRKAE